MGFTCAAACRAVEAWFWLRVWKLLERSWGGGGRVNQWDFFIRRYECVKVFHFPRKT